MSNQALVLAFPGLLKSADDPAVKWEPFRAGIEICRLYLLEAGGPAAALLRYAPGARLPRHEHRGFEHIIVLRGSQRDDNGLHRAGDMLVHPPGSSHEIYSEEGCVVVALWEKPVQFITPAPEVVL